MRRRRKRDCGEGQREESGEIRLSLSTIRRSSGSRASLVGREEGDENEKSSNMVPVLVLVLQALSLGECGLRAMGVVWPGSVPGYRRDWESRDLADWMSNRYMRAWVFASQRKNWPSTSG